MLKHDIKFLVYDFDGVLTDNRVWVSEDGKESVACHRGDGWWIARIRELGIEQVILSSEKNPVVSIRGEKLRLEVHQGSAKKEVSLKQLVETRGLDFSQVAYVGNEMNDLGCFELAKFSFAPEDSHPKILEKAFRVIPAKGGYGVVRYLYDWLVGDWE